MIIIVQASCGIKGLFGEIGTSSTNHSALFDNFKSEARSRLGYFCLKTDITSDFQDNTIIKIMLEQALAKLSDEKRYLITQLFYYNRTERGLAAELHQTQQNINKAKQRILCKLYEILKN